MRQVLSIAVAVGALVWAAGPAIAADQPHMMAALQALEQAHHEIEIADQARDHGSHAGAATNLFDRRSVRQGKAFASGTCTVREHVGLIASGRAPSHVTSLDAAASRNVVEMAEPHLFITKVQSAARQGRFADT
jgi:hypothetical protein